MRITVAGVAVLAGCGGGEDMEELLNAWLREQYPQGHEAGEDAGSIDVDEPGSEVGHDPIFSSQVLSTTVSPVGEGGSVCMGFGDPTSGWCVPADDPDVVQQGDSATLAFTLPPELCANLSEICHDIRCYEFAETSAGVFTAADVALLASSCGSCDEPSCADLIDSCDQPGFCLTDDDCGPREACLQGSCVGAGELRFSLTWSAPRTDFDLYVETPGGAVISYQQPSAGGGVLDRDDVDGGPSSIENIFFDDPNPGTYRVWVQLYEGGGGTWSLAVYDGVSPVLNESGSLTGVGSETDKFEVAQ